MNLKKLPKVEQEIYWVCYERPKDIYGILADLSHKGIDISYSYCCQKCGVLSAKGFLKKIILTSRRILYHSQEIEEEKKLGAPQK